MENWAREGSRVENTGQGWEDEGARDEKACQGPGHGSQASFSMTPFDGGPTTGQRNPSRRGDGENGTQCAASSSCIRSLFPLPTEP